MRFRGFLATLLSLLLVCTAASSPTAVGKMNTKGTAEVNGAIVPGEATLFSGDRIATQKSTASGLSFSPGNQVFLAALTAAQVHRTGNQVTVTLERGALAVVDRSANPVVVEANGVRIGAAGSSSGIYEVALHGTGLKVMARKGTALVKASNRTVEVKEGTTMEATVAAGPFAAGGLSPLMTVVVITSATLGITGFILGIQALLRPHPEDCVVVSPNRISCP